MSKMDGPPFLNCTGFYPKWMEMRVSEILVIYAMLDKAALVQLQE